MKKVTAELLAAGKETFFVSKGPKMPIIGRIFSLHSLFTISKGEGKIWVIFPSGQKVKRGAV